MTVKTAVKKVARRGLLWNLRVAARPTLRYEAAPPDFSHAPRKLLVVRPDHLGDMLLMTPALAWLRRNFPETHITVLAGTWGTASLENNPDIDHIQRCDFPGFSREAKSSPLSPYAYALEQSRKLRAQGYDAAINFRPDFWWGALLLYLADIPIRIGYNWQESKGFYTHEIPLALPPDFALPFGQSARHSTSLNLRLAAAFGELYGKPAQISPAEGILRFQPSAEDERYIKMLLAEWGIQPGDKLVAIHPGTGATIKLWTVESFAAVADGLARQPNVRVVLTGTEKEKTLLKNIAKICRTEPLQLDTTGWWGRAAALFARCNLVIGLDSGPLHLAVATGTSTIHLFGPTDPAIYGPWGDPARHRVIRTEIDLPCCPCGVLDFERVCWKGGYCLRTVKSSQVLDAAHELLA
jgi:ADP-heptose:LPS heptosyltransferase